jgi:WD40 repeat protein
MAKESDPSSKPLRKAQPIAAKSATRPAAVASAPFVRTEPSSTRDRLHPRKKKSGVNWLVPTIVGAVLVVGGLVVAMVMMSKPIDDASETVAKGKKPSSSNSKSTGSNSQLDAAAKADAAKYRAALNQSDPVVKPAETPKEDTEEETDKAEQPEASPALPEFSIEPDTTPKVKPTPSAPKEKAPEKQPEEESDEAPDIEDPEVEEESTTESPGNAEGEDVAPPEINEGDGDLPELKLVDLIAKLKPGTVRIDVTTEQGSGVGSGFVLDRQGTVVTNYHVIEGAKSVEVVFSDRSTAKSTGYLAISPGRDVAIIRIDATQDQLHPAVVAKQLPPEGEKVAALGAPRGLSFTTSDGIVSAIRAGDDLRETFMKMAGHDEYARLGYDVNATWIQTSAPISPGNSGGPLVNMRGEVIGINTWGAREGQLNFAATCVTIREVLATAGKLREFSTLPAPRRSILGDDEDGEGGPPPFDPNAPELPAQVASNRNVGEVYEFKEHTASVNDIAISPDGRYLATAGSDKCVYVIDLQKLTVLRKLTDEVERFTCLSFTGDGKYLITCMAPGTRGPQIFSVWNPYSGQQLLRMNANNADTPRDIAMSPGDGYMATAHTGKIELRKYPILQLAEPISSGEANVAVNAVAFDGDNYVALGTASGKVLISTADIFFPETAGEMKAHNGAINHLAFAPNGKFIATAGADGLLRLWSNFQTKGQWAAKLDLRGHKDAISRFEWSSDGNLIVSASADKTVRVWDLAKAKSKYTLTGHTGAVTSVALFKSQNYVASGSADGKVKIWYIGSGKPSKGGAAEADIVANNRPRPVKRTNGAVPSDADTKTATKELREVFADRYAKAKKPEEKSALAATMLKQALDDKTPPRDRYALLSEAQTLAVDAGNVSQAFDIADGIVSYFDVRTSSVQAEVVNKLESKIRNDADRTQLASVALQWAGEAYDANQFDDALTLLKTANALAPRTKSGDLVKRSASLKRDAQEAKTLYDEYRKAVAAIKDDANDAQANFVIGRYLCFVRGTWNKGLKYIIRGNDDAMKKLATEDLANPTAAEKQVALAEQWAKMSDAVAAPFKQACRGAAYYWYGKSIAGLTGIAKLKAEGELKKLGDIPADKLRR